MKFKYLNRKSTTRYGFDVIMCTTMQDGKEYCMITSFSYSEWVSLTFLSRLWALRQMRFELSASVAYLMKKVGHEIPKKKVERRSA